MLQEILNVLIYVFQQRLIKFKCIFFEAHVATQIFRAIADRVFFFIVPGLSNHLSIQLK
jgi:hypothetical protein